MNPSISQEPGGYPEYLFISQPSENFICGICRSIIKDCVRSCVNDHNYCRYCLLRHLESSGKACPECRAPVKKSPPTCRALNAVISELSVRCITCEDTNSHCTWTGLLKDLDTHVLNCQFVPVTCSFEGCGACVYKQELMGHEAACSHRTVHCDLCNEVLPIAAVEKHNAESCPKRIVECPNYCGERMEAQFLSAHRDLCLLEPVDCPWKDLAGCDYRSTRAHIAAHASDSASHFTCVMTKLASLSEQVQALTIENSSLKLQVQQCANEVSFAWEIPNFDTEREYQSPYFQAFGHSLLLTFGSAHGRADYHGLFLKMKSRVPAKLGFVFTVGRYVRHCNPQCTVRHSVTKSSHGLLDFPYAEGHSCGVHGQWIRGKSGMTRTDTLNRGELINPNGALQIHVTVSQVWTEGHA
jgi:hypothetical protein